MACLVGALVDEGFEACLASLFDDLHAVGGVLGLVARCFVAALESALRNVLEQLTSYVAPGWVDASGQTRCFVAAL